MLDDTTCFHVQWHLTEACNLRCKHCYREAHRRECSAAERRTIADRLVAFAAERGRRLTVALTGGEPFLLPDVYDLADGLCGSAGEPIVSFITNGTVPIDMARLGALPSLTAVYVSLEGPETLNDAVRGVGAYDAAMSGIDALSRAGVRVGVMTTVMRGTVGHLVSRWREYADELAGRGVSEVILERFVPVGAAAAQHNDIAPAEDVRALYAVIAAELGIDPAVLSDFKALRVMLRGATEGGDAPVLYGAVCTAGREGCAVLCDGTIYPCRRLPIALGNVLTDPLETVLPADLSAYRVSDDAFGCRAMARARGSVPDPEPSVHELV